MLIKGGHEEGDALADALIEADNMTSWQGQRIDTTSTHGTGCTLASAIAFFLARGRQRCPRRSTAPGEFVRVALHEAPGLGGGAGPLGQGRVRLDVGAGLRLNQVTVTGNDYDQVGRFLTGARPQADRRQSARLCAVRDRRRRDLLDPDRSRGDVGDDRHLFRMRRPRRRVDRLARAGMPFEHGPRNQPWMWREARLRDPVGNIIFLYKAGEARRFPPWRIDD